MWATLIIISKIVLCQIIVMPLAFIFTGMLMLEWQWLVSKLKNWHRYLKAVLAVTMFLLFDIVGTVLFIAADSKTIVMFN